MRELRLMAVSDDGAHLYLAGHDDELMALRVDDRLHAAIRGDRARLGQLDIQLESQLRPRDIQARIRAGESLDAVAAVAGMPRDKVERFAGPVIAEREHIAERARQATVRRLGGDGPPQTLEAAATATANAHGTDASHVEWDAWRREDGRWLVQFTWGEGEPDDTALFSFDPSGRSVQPENDRARVIAGIAPAEPEPEPAPEPDIPTGPARLSVVESPPSDDNTGPSAAAVSLAAGAPIHELARSSTSAVDHDDEREHTSPIPASRRSRRGQRGSRPAERRRREPELWSDPVEDQPEATDTSSDDEATSERLHLSDIASRVETEEQPDLAPTADEPAPPQRKASGGSSRSRRPSVPSWDEIMFGRRKGD